MKLRFAGTKRRHADRPAARLNELDFDAVFAEVALLLGDIDRRFALAYRAGGEEDFGHWGCGVHGYMRC